MVHERFRDWRIILASQSPRRRNLLQGLDLNYETTSLDVDESFPDDMEATEVPVFLSQLKASAYPQPLPERTLLITADTTVVLNNQSVNKPADRTEAVHMLEQLSGNTHTVVTGVTLTSATKSTSFAEHTTVSFHPLTDQEIAYYVDQYQPFDKAGSYGIQEWLGYMAVNRIEGCFFNVMGLPLHRLYQAMLTF